MTLNIKIMFYSAVLLVSIITTSVWAVDIHGVTTSEKFEQSAILDRDEKFILFWNYNDTHVTFEVHDGLVSVYPAVVICFPADVVVGWINKNGTTHFTDRHTVGHTSPIIDQSQDWNLLFAEENDFGTVLKFVRQIRTCDEDYDENIQIGTSRVIFAYGTSDPIDENFISYHSTTRGTKSLALLSKVAELDHLPTDSRHFDFLNKNYLVPNDTTMYWCTAFKMPPIGKHHMIKYEALITPGNEMNVHHILIYRCKVRDPDRWDGQAGICYNNQRVLPQCGNIVIAWAIGGGPFYFPPDAGFFVGGPDDAVFYIMETHFDNPNRLNNMIDNSGIRITLTPTLRRHEAGMLTLCHIVGYFQIIPPQLQKFTTKGYCSSECLDEGFRQSNLTEVKMIGLVQHSHLLGRSITTRHFRNGVKLKPLMEDPYYDFNFQSIRNLPREVTVQPGDSFQVDCTYNSEGRTGPTLGGLSIEEEMCLTFAYYYPKMTLSNCLSEPIYDSFSFSYKELGHVIQTSDWHNNTFVDYFVNNIDNSRIYQVCTGDKFQSKPEQIVLPPPQNSHPYVAPPPDCS